MRLNRLIWDTIAVHGKTIRVVGFLTVDGQDLGDTLIAENLAHPLICGQFSCPKRKAWCPFEPAQ